MLAAGLGWLAPAAQAQTCAAPTNVIVSSVSSATSITTVVSFTPSASALSYTVRYYWIGDSTAAGMMSVNTTTSPVTLTGLQAATYYRVSVVSHCAGGLTTASPWVRFLAGSTGSPGSGSCAAPTNISVNSPTATTAVVSFTPSATATSYTVRYFWTGDSTAAGTFTVNTTTSPVTLTGLRPASYYVVYVTSNCAGGGTATSGWHVFQTSGGGVLACAMPTNVTVTTVNNLALSVGFTPVAGAASYTVQYYPSNDSTQVQTIIGTGSPILIGNGLLPGTTYIIRIRTNCTATTASAPVTVIGQTGGPASCNAPSGFYVGTTTTTTASVAFILDSNYLNYVVGYYPVGSNPATAQTLTVTSAPVQLTGLTPSTAYTVTIRANCATGGTSPARSTAFTTNSIPAPCGTVTNITVTATSASTATVNFTPGVGNTSFHIAYYSSAVDSTWISTNGSSVTLTGLVPGHTYTIRVMSVCGTATGTTYNPTATPVTFSFRGALASRAALGKGEISVFPNPAQRTTSIVLSAVSGAAQAQLTLLNNVGQSVRTLTVPLAKAGETRTQLDLGGIKAGLYTLRIQAGNQTASQRLAVE